MLALLDAAFAGLDPDRLRAAGRENLLLERWWYQGSDLQISSLDDHGKLGTHAHGALVDTVNRFS